MANLFGKEMTYEEFIKAWGEKAVSRYSDSKVLPSLIICQAILESGWGTSGIAQTLGNYHGMNYYNDGVTKGYSYATRTTQQERDGQLVDSVEQFCKFSDIDEELDCLYKWYERDKPAYKALHGCTDALKNFKLIKDAGYATSSAYTESLTRIYEQYPSIKTYDDMVLSPTPTIKHLYFVQIGAFKNKNYVIFSN
jgi:flagellum-specific peptidoglycan hydrolase FlgJ